MPNIRLADILKKQTAFYLVTIKIDDDPLKLIKEPNPDLQLNGFSVTLAELTTMYQVGGKREKLWFRNNNNLIAHLLDKILQTFTCFQM